MTKNKPTAPIINLNGTNGKELLEKLEGAEVCLRQAIMALGDMAPHGRDYQVSPEGAFQLATIEHSNRMTALKEVLGEITDITLNVYDQVRAREDRRAK